MKVLFLSRAYPPVTGGIENHNHALYSWLRRHVPTTLVANRFGKKALPLFLPYATAKALLALRHHDVLLLGDGVLALTGFLAKRCFPGRRVFCVVHGLDVTYPSRLYRSLWVRRFLPALDGLIAVSGATRAAALAHGIPAEKLVVIPNGIDPAQLEGAASRKDLERLLGRSVDGKQVLLTTGRLVKRKGAEWFIRAVMPLLPESVLYVLVGSGPEERHVRDTVRELRLEGRVSLLGRVSDGERNVLLHTADLFVQPNIRVPGDMEGFGIAVLEAALCARPVVAADLEGLKDAVRNGDNGLLVEPQNAQAFREAIMSLLEKEDARRALGRRAREYTLAHYHWDAISSRYRATLEAALVQRK